MTMTQKSEKQIEYTIATHAVERLTPSEAAVRLCEQLSDEIINVDTAVDAILRRYGLKQVAAND